MENCCSQEMWCRDLQLEVNAAEPLKKKKSFLLKKTNKTEKE